MTGRDRPSQGPVAPRAGVYVRISRDGAGEGLGVRRQEKECRQAAEELGWSVVEVYADNDTSAYSRAKRPAYERLLEDIEDGHLDALIAWHPDRLHRRPQELEQFMAVIESSRLDVHTVKSGKADFSSPSGRLHARMLGDIATYESEHKSTRLRSKAAELAQAGKVGGGGRRPYGFEKDRVTVREAEAEHIREAAERVLGGESLTAIVRDWSERSVPTVTGTEWSTTAMKTVLKAPRVAGLREHKGEVVADAVWPEILDRQTWERVRAVLVGPSRRKTRRSRKYLLTGLASCGLCGHPLVGAPRTPKRGDGKRGQYVYEKGKTLRAYGCVKANGGCGGVYILALPLEQFVVDVVLHRLRGARLDRTRARLAKASAGEAKWMGVIEDYEVELRELGRESVAKSMNRLVVEGKVEVIQERIDEARTQLSRITRTKALDAVHDIDVEWPDLGPDRQRAVLDAVLRRVVVDPATGPRNRFDPDRVSPIWAA